MSDVGERLHLNSVAPACGGLERFVSLVKTGSNDSSLIVLYGGSMLGPAPARYALLGPLRLECSLTGPLFMVGRMFDFLCLLAGGVSGALAVLL